MNETLISCHNIILFPFSAKLANPAVGVYLEAHAELGTDFSVEFYGTVGDKVIEAMNGTGVPYKIFKTKLGYSRV